MSNLMKAIVITEPRKVEIREIEKPVRKEGEALLKLLYGGICGSDLNTFRGTSAYVSYPRIPGHEFSAEIVEIGENNSNLKVGDKVTCNPYFNCGTCYSCKRGLVNCCTSNQTMGVQREGAFAQYITMPLERIYKSEIDPMELALVEPFCISQHGTTRGSVTKGDKVLVIGAGTIGVLAALSASLKGAEVYIADISPDKLEYAKKFGVKGVVNSYKENAIEDAVAKFTNGDGFDVTIEAVGLASTFQQAIDAAAFGGRVVLIGVSKQHLDFDFTIIQRKELNVFGSRNAFKNDFMEIIELVKKDTPLKDIVTNVYDAGDIEKAFTEFDANAGSMLKVVIDFTKM